ncbi:MAG: Spy/CpxP family protein refolding chaperone [Microcoleaceae cyanobacterium MO_207.B10]|nr:Spy/CpxP family protein refolding chaperone [Microcoleaceae cyanobacterium MO_207.B10]
MSRVLISTVLGLLVMPLTISPALANSNYNNFPIKVSQTRQAQESQGSEEGIFKQLNLSEDQTEKIIAIRDQHQQNMIDSLQKLRGAQEELNNMIISSSSDNQLREKHSEVIQLRTELAELQFDTILKMREVLTPEQLQKWSNLMQQRRESVKNRLGN